MPKLPQGQAQTGWVNKLCSGARENTPCRVLSVLGKGKEMGGKGEERDCKEERD